MVATKAPKALHLSGSAYLNYRVAACVAQKNRGHRYLLKVHEKIGVSPGDVTKKAGILRPIQLAKKKAINSTHAAMKRRLKLKNERYQRSSSKEVREGRTYFPETDLEENMDTKVIPPHEETAEMECMKGPMVVFDLETTGLGRDSHITQIAALAMDSEDSFSCYVMPKCFISKQAMKITGISNRGNQLFHNGTPVPYHTIREALKLFLKFLEKIYEETVVLFGHNKKSFDSLVLMNALNNCKLIDTFINHVSFFIDSRLLFQKSHPEHKSFSQVNLVKVLLGETYDAPNALQDVKSLKKLIPVSSDLSTENLKKSAFSYDYAVQSFKYSRIVSLNIPTFQSLLNRNIISKNIARKIAGSGLRFQHLEIVFMRNGRQGIEDLFAETVNGKVRVTKNVRIIEAVCDYLSTLK